MLWLEKITLNECPATLFIPPQIPGFYLKHRKVLYSCKINTLSASFHVEAESQTKSKLGNVPDPIELDGIYAVGFRGSLQSDTASDVWWPGTHLVSAGAPQAICHPGLLIELGIVYSLMLLFLNFVTNGASYSWRAISCYQKCYHSTLK